MKILLLAAFLLQCSIASALNMDLRGGGGIHWFSASQMNERLKADSLTEIYLIGTVFGEFGFSGEGVGFHGRFMKENVQVSGTSGKTRMASLNMESVAALFSIGSATKTAELQVFGGPKYVLWSEFYERTNTTTNIYKRGSVWAGIAGARVQLVVSPLLLFSEFGYDFTRLSKLRSNEGAPTLDYIDLYGPFMNVGVGFRF